MVSRAWSLWDPISSTLPLPRHPGLLDGSEPTSHVPGSGLHLASSTCQVLSYIASCFISSIPLSLYPDATFSVRSVQIILPEFANHPLPTSPLIIPFVLASIIYLLTVYLFPYKFLSSMQTGTWLAVSPMTVLAIPRIGNTGHIFVRWMNEWKLFSLSVTSFSKCFTSLKLWLLSTTWDIRLHSPSQLGLLNLRFRRAVREWAFGAGGKLP